MQESQNHDNILWSNDSLEFRLNLSEEVVGAEIAGGESPPHYHHRPSRDVSLRYSENTLGKKAGEAGVQEVEADRVVGRGGREIGVQDVDLEYG